MEALIPIALEVSMSPVAGSNEPPERAESQAILLSTQDYSLKGVTLFEGLWKECFVGKWFFWWWFGIFLSTALWYTELYTSVKMPEKD